MSRYWRKKYDRNRKKAWKIKKEYFSYNSKKCSKCGKRRKHHHYLCDGCWEEIKNVQTDTKS